MRLQVKPVYAWRSTRSRSSSLLALRADGRADRIMIESDLDPGVVADVPSARPIGRDVAQSLTSYRGGLFDHLGDRPTGLCRPALPANRVAPGQR